MKLTAPIIIEWLRTKLKNEEYPSDNPFWHEYTESGFNSSFTINYEALEKEMDLWLNETFGEMKPLEYEAFGQKYQVEVRELKYFNGRAALRLIDTSPGGFGGECILTASVNMPELECPAGEVWIKNYGENEGILPWLIKHGFIERESEAVHVLNFGDIISRHRLRRPKVTGPLDSCDKHSPLGGTDHD